MREVDNISTGCGSCAQQVADLLSTDNTSQVSGYVVCFIQNYTAHSASSLFAPFAHSLKTFFLIFPVLVFGNSLTTSTSLGTINLLISLLFFAHSITSFPSKLLPDFVVMNAFGLSPQCESATATTPHSRISGCVISALSSATEDMFSPPVETLANPFFSQMEIDTTYQK